MSVTVGGDLRYAGGHLQQIKSVDRLPACILM